MTPTIARVARTRVALRTKQEAARLNRFRVENAEIAFDGARLFALTQKANGGQGSRYELRRSPRDGVAICECMSWKLSTHGAKTCKHLKRAEELGFDLPILMPVQKPRR